MGHGLQRLTRRVASRHQVDHLVRDEADHVDALRTDHMIQGHRVLLPPAAELRPHPIWR